mgnify:CR=1 FL=1
MGKTAFIFPGQGAQKAGMGKDFYENSKTAAEVIDHASELLGLDMKALCFEENDLLDQTEYTQAALVTVCMAMEKVLRERGLAPDVTAGLSLGEYCAIASAGGMSTENAITTVRKRGILMQNAVPGGQGAMAAVLGLDAGKIEEVLADRSGVMIANYNCPGQIVITGWKEDVEQASDALKEAGAKRVLPLNVSGPFHSYLLEEAGEKLGRFLENIPVSEPKIPYVANVTAAYVTKAEDVKPLLTRQVSSSVRWQQSVETMLADGVERFIEIGPGKTLAGFIRKINREATVINIEKFEDLEKLN